VEREPAVASLPDHAPEAEQAVALVVDHVRLVAAPESTAIGFAVSVTIGGEFETVTITDCKEVPPAPAQVSSYSVVLVSAPVLQVPLAATAPCHPPDAVHAVALAAFHVKVDSAPLAIVVGDAVSVIAGPGAFATTTLTDWVACPPVPLQVKE
jgi:hypothetical protein